MVDSERLFSEHWHRVKDVCPRLADDVISIRHVYRGRPFWVLQHRATKDLHRLDGASFKLVDQLDGHRSVGEIWEQAMVENDASAPTQDEWIALLATLQAAELLLVNRRVTPESLFERRDERRSRERRERRLNPLYLRFTLYDPDAMLNRLLPLARVLFSRPVFVAWVLLMVAGWSALLVSGAQLAHLVTSPAFPSSRVAIMMVVIYLPLKLLHELGHALAVKRCGGEVHEAGLALMVLMPLPFVDASASAAFPDKRDRMLVAGAGIGVELTFAAMGAILFATASGAVAEFGMVLLLVGGISTLLINGNPLLRFDGYYMLADALEIPNLATRSRRVALERLRVCLSGEPTREKPTTDVAEQRWLLGYGVASGLYRTGLMLWIAWWLSSRFPLFGAALAAYAVFSACVVPLWRGLKVVLNDTSLHGTRPRLLVTLVPLLLMSLLAWLPLPHSNMTRGVVWLPDESIIRVHSACEISDVAVDPGMQVTKGQTLFRCLDSELALRERELAARSDELKARLAGFGLDESSEQAQLVSEKQANDTALVNIRMRKANGQHVAALDGVFDISGISALEGRALQRGDIAAYIVPSDKRSVRVALAERVAGSLDAGLRRIELRITHGARRHRMHSTSIVARTPRASREVPSAALSSAGGGEHRADPGGNGRQLMEPVFNIEVSWPDELAPEPIGSHVAVRFVYAPTPIAGRLVDALRRALDERGIA